MKIYGNLWKSMKINANLWKSWEICENLYKSMEIYENLFISMEIYENLCKFIKIFENRWNPWHVWDICGVKKQHGYILYSKKQTPHVCVFQKEISCLNFQTEKMIIEVFGKTLTLTR